jgi:hypothetical protein
MGHIFYFPLRRKGRHAWGFFQHRKNPTASAGIEPANSSSKWYVYSFSEIPWIEGEMLRRWYFVLPINCPFYWLIATKFIPIVVHTQNVTYLQVQRDPLNRRQDAAKKVLCSRSKVPFFIDRSRPNLYQQLGVRIKWYVYTFIEIPWMEGEMLRRRYFVLPVKCPC